MIKTCLCMYVLAKSVVRPSTYTNTHTHTSQLIINIQNLSFKKLLLIKTEFLFKNFNYY